MELALLIWFASVSTGIANLFGTLAFIIILAIVIIVFFSVMWYLIEEEVLKIVEYKKSIIGVFIVGLIFAIISVLIPDERTVYLIAAGYAGQKIVESDKFQKSTNDVYEIVNMKLEQIKRDMQEDLNGDQKPEGEAR
ncbi:hypothetical protein TaPaz_137 [Acinetobacter phage TaPaz]|nr:hypothetical protein TaPaz_137 [Acinetobacter phage TaPaz]